MNLFSHVLERRPKRSKKNLSHNTLFDCGFGRIIPTNCQELTANDSSAFSVSNFIQPTNMYAPAFTKIRVRSRTFVVPYRLLYGRDYLEKFMSDSTGEVLEPYTTLEDLRKTYFYDYYDGTTVIPALTNGQLADFFNIATMPLLSPASPGYATVNSQTFLSASLSDREKKPLEDKKISLIKPLAYTKIWDDWYRDENYQNPVWDSLIEAVHNLPTYPYVPYSATFQPDWSSSPINILATIYQYKMANVGKDYFTGSLPFQQAGNPTVLPVGASRAPVKMETQSGAPFAVGANLLGGSGSGSNNSVSDYDSVTNPLGYWFTDNSGGQSLVNVFADLAAATGVTVQEFRSYLAAARWAERNARGGTRLVEVLKSRFGANVPDIFMDRSVYVGGSVEDVKIDTIFSTAATDEGALGSYTGRAYSAGKSKYFGVHTVEPAMLMTVQTILPVPQYFQGISKDNCRLTVFDKVNPEFAHVGEQPVKSDEFFFDYGNLTGIVPDSIWGYVPRYSDYMQHPDEIHGEFRDSLRFWHTGLFVDLNQTQPNLELTEQILNQDYYKDANRIFAVNTIIECQASPFRCVSYFNFYNKTCLPVNPAAII